VREVQVVPTHFDVRTGSIATQRVPVHRFVMRYESPVVRDGSTLKAMEIAARVAEATRAGGGAAGEAAAAAVGGVLGHAPVTMSFIPEHMQRRDEPATSQSSAGSEPAAQPAPAPVDVRMRISSVKTCTKAHASCGYAQHVPILQEVGSAN
jgi:hypothetical protein